MLKVFFLILNALFSSYLHIFESGAMEEPARTPPASMSDSPEPPHSDTIDAIKIPYVPSPAQELRIFARHGSISSTRVSAVIGQPDQQMESESPGSTMPSDPASILNEPDDAHCSSPKRYTRRAAFWKTMGTITGFFLTG